MKKTFLSIILSIIFFISFIGCEEFLQTYEKGHYYSFSTDNADFYCTIKNNGDSEGITTITPYESGMYESDGIPVTIINYHDRTIPCTPVPYEY